MHRWSLKTVILLLGASALVGCATENAPAAGASGAKRVVFTCADGAPLTVTFTEGAAQLESAGASVRLTQQRAASGIYYSGEGHVLRGKGPDMTWTDPAGATHACRDEALAGGAAPATGASALSGTAWTLVSFRPQPSGAPVVPPNLGRYTLEFAADGGLSLQLDCNRGMGRWTATPSAPNAGMLTVTGGAMTRAMCGPGAMDTQISGDLNRVRSYAVEGGQLSLVLDDGDVYLWAPKSPGGG